LERSAVARDPQLLRWGQRLELFIVGVVLELSIPNRRERTTKTADRSSGETANQTADGRPYERFHHAASHTTQHVLDVVAVVTSFLRSVPSSGADGWELHAAKRGTSVVLSRALGTLLLCYLLLLPLCLQKSDRRLQDADCVQDVVTVRRDVETGGLIRLCDHGRHGHLLDAHNVSSVTLPLPNVAV
jgi:hypothetical protein